MSDSEKRIKTTDVPAQVFNDFIESLAKTDVPPGVISRLRKTLLEDKAYSESALRASLFGTQPLR